MAVLGQPLLDALERMSCGDIILDATGAVLLVNSTAQRILAQEIPNSRDSYGSPEWFREATKSLLRRAPERFSLDHDYWAMVPREHERALALHAVSVANGTDAGPHTVLIFVDLAETPKPNTTALMRMFGLTAAEASLAVQIASGKTPAEIAKSSGIAAAPLAA